MGQDDGRTCSGCWRGDPCETCGGVGCGACIQTGRQHYFNEALEHILQTSPKEARNLRDRIVERLL